jgi:Ca-activated chloride channel family protein
MQQRILTLILSLALALAIGACDVSSLSSSESIDDGNGVAIGQIDDDPNKNNEENAPPAVSDASVSPNESSGDYEEGTVNQGPYPEPMEPGAQDEEDPTNEGDKYEDVGANPFTIVAHDPQSTFSIDVDTASYDLFRRDAGNYGWLPHETGVRLEEYVNNFAYDYAAPSHESNTPFAFSVEAAPSPYRDVTLMRIGIKGKMAPPEEKKPANVVFLIDVSGSMSSNLKLPLVKTVLSETVTMLDGSDTISIVTYAGHTAVHLEPTPVSESAAIFAAIEGMTSGGSTAGAQGIQLAYAQAEDGYIEGGVNHVILCTDGDFNVGISNDDALVELIEEKRKTGITLTVLGFGSGNLNDSMMEKVSNAGNGVYGVIANADHAVTYVQTKMLSNLYFIAKDVKIQVDFNPARVLAYRLLGYENRAIADELFEDHTIDAGEIGAGHTVTALFEIVHAGDPIPQVDGAPGLEDGDAFDGELEVLDGELCRVKIRYKDPSDSMDDPSFGIAYGVADGDVADHIEATTPDFQFATAVAGLAEMLRLSPYAGIGDLEHIRSLAEQNAGTKADRLEFLELLDIVEPMLKTEPQEDDSE